MRILFLSHAPWSRNYGGPRPQMELADELSGMGHQVRKFDIGDCFANWRVPQRLRPWLANHHWFSRRAKKYLIRNGAQFDVVEALQGNLPFPKRHARFTGLMVARSVGLQAHYEEVERTLGSRLPGHHRGKLIPSWLRGLLLRRDAPLYDRSLRTADLVNVCNKDELNYCLRDSELRDRAVYFPLGLTQQRFSELSSLSQFSKERFEKPLVAFIGLWIPRKGCLDMRAIIEGILQATPEARIRLLGTGGFGMERIWQDLTGIPRDKVEVIPSYTSDELPALLREATVGAFPSYMEGWGYGLLEKMAAGLPSVAYDVPGPREMLRNLGTDYLVDEGNIADFVKRVTNLLTLPEDQYLNRVAEVQRGAALFHWREIASQTLACYDEALQRIKKVGEN